MNPSPPNMAPPQVGPPPQWASKPLAGVDRPAFPDPMGTLVLLFGLVIVWMLTQAMGGETTTASKMLRTAAWGTGVALGISYLFDLRHGIRNMVRSDMLALLAIYGISYAEFIFPDEEMIFLYDSKNAFEPTQSAIGLVTLAMGVFAMARHITTKNEFTTSVLFTAPVNPMILVRLFWACFILGFMHQWFAVNFNPIEWFEAMMRRRWAQPWGRSHFGDWKAMIYELRLLGYVVTPLGAIILVRRKMFSSTVVFFVSIALFINLFHAFTTGTRHIFFVHVILFTTAVVYFQRFTVKLILVAGGLAMGVMLVSTNIQLAFRNVGFKRWLLERKAGAVYAQEEGSLYVDMMFQNLNRLVSQVPDVYNYLGFEVLYYAMVRPIPRAVWPKAIGGGKPEALSTTLEEILWEPGVSGTWSVTFVGESYLAFGVLGVIVIAGLFGMGANFWNRFGSPGNSDMGILIFASGFFQFSIAMRSMMEFTTAILPTIALLFFVTWLVRNRQHLLAVTPGQRDANQMEGLRVSVLARNPTHPTARGAVYEQPAGYAPRVIPSTATVAPRQSGTSAAAQSRKK